MNNQVDITTYNGSLVVSSRRVADNFGKQHKHVLEAIENIKAENSAVKKYSTQNCVHLPKIGEMSAKETSVEFSAFRFLENGHSRIFRFDVKSKLFT